MESGIYEIYTPGSGQIEVKKSRFIGDAFSVHNEEEVQEYVAGIRKKHYDARHHCYAYILGDENAVRASDDGEPQGTAGKPILEVITKEGMRNTLVIVTRYFGGTLLGTGGLTRAYSQAAKEALNSSILIEKHTGIRFKVTMGYDILGKLENLINGSEDIYEVDSDYGENVTKTFVVPLYMQDRVSKKIIEMSADRAMVEMSQEIEYGIADNRVLWL